MTVLLDVEVRGQRVDVRLGAGVVAEVVRAGTIRPSGDEVIEGRGGALLPGLHDQHLHLLAIAADRASVDCSGSLDDLASAQGHWVRGVRSPLSVDRHVLDRFESARPVRVQHRSGALWMLNSRALAEVAHVLDDSPDVERDRSGEPTGRLWRYDARLRQALDDDPPEMAALGRVLTSYGLSRVTDATPDLDDPSIFSALPQRVILLGRRKLLLHDHALPDFHTLADIVRQRHQEGPVAVHCVTAEALVLTLGVLEEAGVVPGDRIEHAAVVPPGAAAWMARLGVRVVTQPAFLADRGDAYRRELEPADLAGLYPFASLLSAGVRTSASSDAPYGPLDPWQVIRAARDRCDPEGIPIGPQERVDASTALTGYLCDARGVPRRVAVGQPGDMTLLHVPLAEAMATPQASLVRRVLFALGDD